MYGIKLAFYKKQDWKRFIEIIDDRETMHETWKQWHKAYLKLRKHFISQGFEVVDIEVDLEELIQYCRLNGLKNDGSARSKFVQTK